MSMSAVGQRLHNILETDWKREAELLLAERMQTENGDVSKHAKAVAGR